MKKKIICLILFLAITAAGTGYCSDAVIDDVAVDSNSSLNVSFAVKNAFTKDIEEAIKSGVATSFTFYIELDRVKSLWFDESMGRWEFKHTVKYDTLKEEYVIDLAEKGEEGRIRTKDMSGMKKEMVTVRTYPLDMLRGLQKGERYELRVMAELHTVKLPLMLDYVLFFVRLWDFETDWHEYGFTY